MTSKHRTLCKATRSHRAAPASAKRLARPLRTQRGVSLIEMLVGIAIGLMVVAVAMGALMVSRGVTGTVGDASNIQQQAAYAMRIIGAQVRQTASFTSIRTPRMRPEDLTL